VRLLIITDAWFPQINGVVRTLSTTRDKLIERGHQVEVLAPERFKNIPCPTYPEIRLALCTPTSVGRHIEAAAPEAVHIATEGPLGWAARAWMKRRRLPFTSSFHTLFPQYLKLRFGLPETVSFSGIRRFHGGATATMYSTPTLRAMLEQHGFENLVRWVRGVDTDIFTPGPAAELPFERPIQLYVGRIAVEKSIEDFLRLDTPGTKVVVGDGPHRQELTERYPGVRILASVANRGPGAARNAGMRAARNRWVLAVDNDAVLEPDTLERLLAAHAACPDAVVLQPRSLVDDDPERVHYDAGWFHYVGLLSLRNFYAPLSEAEGEGVVDVDALVGIAPLVDRDALLGVGGYDEDYFYLAEDFDLALRLRLAGHRIVAVEDALVRHRGGSAGLSFRGGGYPERRAYLHARNRWILLAKCLRARTLVLASPGILLYELVFTAFAALEGNLGAHLRGKRDFFRTLDGTRAKRRAVQATRRLRDRELLVGGPLTLSPSLLESTPRRLFARTLNGALAAWWWLVRGLAG